MKKLISIIAALSMIASLGVTSFAAIDASISVTDAAKATLAKQDDGSFTADLAANSNASQDTIVVIKGTNPDDITTTSIEYINQDAASQNFNFVLKNTPSKAEDFTEGNTLTYTVLMGGDTVSKTEVGTITYTYTKDVVYYTVTFYDEDGENVLGTGSYEENTAVTIPADPTKAEDENNTYAFAGWKVKGAEDSTAVKLTELTATANTEYVAVYTATPKVPEGGEEADFTISLNSGLTGTVASAPYNVTNGKIIRITGLTATDVVTVTVDGTPYTAKYYTTTDGEIVHVVALATATEVTSDMISVTTGTPTEAKFGDCNGDTRVNAVDITYFRRCNAKYTMNGEQMALPTDIESLILWDVDGNGRVNAVDITAFRRASAKYTLNGVQLTLPTMGAYTKK